jgi:hypothetical protein
MKRYRTRRIRRSLIMVVTAIVVTVTIACDSSPDRAGFLAPDSATVMIRDHPTLDTTQASQLMFPARPSVRIGVVDGEATYQLFHVRHAYRRLDGTIVVTNSGTAEVRAYDGQGQWQWSSGRQGDGPGEFQFLAWAQPYRGDSIVAFDGSTGRVSILSPRGAYVRSFQPIAPGDHPRANVVGSFADGSVLASYGMRPVTTSDSIRAERPTEQYGIFDAEGSFVRTVGDFVADEQFVWTDGSLVSVGAVPFGSVTATAVLDELFVVGDNMTFETRTYDRRGTLKQILRIGMDRQPLGREVAERHRAAELEEIPESPFRPVQQRALQATPYPSHYPYYGDVVVTRPSRAYWIQLAPQFDQVSDRWLAFEHGGAYRGWYAIPRPVRITDVGDRFVVGIATDQVGVEFVEVYDLGAAH